MTSFSSSRPAHSTLLERTLTSQRVQRGDLWRLGRHRLLCGDCTNEAQVAKLFGAERATLTITSPPYNIGGRRGMFTKTMKGGSKYLNSPDALSHADYLTLLGTSTQNALEVSEIVVFNVQMLSSNKVALIEFWHRFRHDFCDVILWDKGRARPAISRNVLNARFEFLLFFTKERSKGKTPRTIPTADFRGTLSNVYAAPPQSNNRYHKTHAATFPLHLPLWLMNNFSPKESLVFDPFLGTGTTLIAAEKTERRCFGMEVDPVYCETVLQRWEEETGQTAVRIPSEKPTVTEGSALD